MPAPLDPNELDQFLRQAAKLLAPYLKKEFDRPTIMVSAAYDQPTCELFAKGLGDTVLPRAILLFDELEASARVASPELARILGAKSPKSLPGSVTTPIKLRAKELGLPLPFAGGLGSKLYGGIEPLPGDDPRRTYWEDAGGIAGRMREALRAEAAARGVSVPALGDKVPCYLVALRAEVAAEPAEQIEMRSARLASLVGSIAYEEGHLTMTLRLREASAEEAEDRARAAYLEMLERAGVAGPKLELVREIAAESG